MHYVTDVSYIKDYTPRVVFENKTSKVVDLQPYLDGPVFEPLKDLDFFKKVRVNRDIDTIVWPNDADFAPEFLYEIGR
jgi:hypothetical protein